MGDRHDALALGLLKQEHSLRLAPGDVDVMQRAADELAAVGYQHDRSTGREGRRRHRRCARYWAMLAPRPPLVPVGPVGRLIR
jgi:hypothetical protein